MKNNFIVWSAGFFDGEGCIMIQRRKRGNFIEHSLSVVVGQKNIKPLQAYKDFYGGILTKRTTSGCYQWRSHGTTAELFLKQIIPFLVLKKDEAEIALKLRKLVNIPGKRMKQGIWEKKENLWIEFRTIRERKKNGEY